MGLTDELLREGFIRGSIEFERERSRRRYWANSAAAKERFKKRYYGDIEKHRAIRRASYKRKKERGMKTYEAFVSREKEVDTVSKKIMEHIKADYSHCGIIEWENGVGTVWDSTEKGFQPSSLEDFLKERELVGRVELPVKDLSFARGWLRGCKGKEYSSSQYAGFISESARRYVSNGDEKLVCSEALIRFALECCQWENPFKDLDWVDPKQAWEFVLSKVIS